MAAQKSLAVLALCAALSACADPSPEAFWSEYTQDVREAGFLRVERAPIDAPFDAKQVAVSFETIGFSFETDPFGTGSVIEEEPMIRRWAEPISYTLIAEDSDLVRIRALLDGYTARLTTLTGLGITETDPANPQSPPSNVFVLFGRDEFLFILKSYDDLRSAGYVSPNPDRDRILALLGEVLAPWYAAPSPCAGQVFLGDGEGDTLEGEVMFAIVMMRSEIPDPLLTACVEEEMAQLLGLFDDDDTLRPSIFNDDQEFALLTDLDSTLLQILYDERLTIGMPPEQAMPIVRRIAEELASGS